MEAADAGYGDQYRREAQAILADLKPLTRASHEGNVWMQPAQYGFGPENNGGKPIINLSYWVFPALDRLSSLTGDHHWRGASEDGKVWLDRALTDAKMLPSDWSVIDFQSGALEPAVKMGTSYSYNAVRIPLHLAWAARPDDNFLRHFHAAWVRRGVRLSQWDAVDGRELKPFVGQGYESIAALLDCVVEGHRFPTHLRSKLDGLYYSASLQLFSIIAIKQKYRSCW